MNSPVGGWTAVPTPRNPWSNWIVECGLWLAYCLIAVTASWPLCASISSAIPIGYEAEATVPLLNVWTLWWNSDCAASGFRRYWDAPIFFPTKGTFAFSEAQPPMILMGPIVWLSGNRVLAYNIYLLLILSLNGWSSWRLLKRVGHHPWLAFCGGVMCEMLPFVWWQLGVVQLTTIFGINWTLHSLLDVFAPELDATSDPIRRRLASAVSLIARSFGFTASKSSSPSISVAAADRVRGPRDSWVESLVRAGRLGGSFCLTYVLCNYWGLFLAMLLVPSSIWLWNRRCFRLRFWCEVGLGTIVVLVVIGPIAFVQKSLASQHRWYRERSLIFDLSAHPRDYLDTPRTSRPLTKVQEGDIGDAAGLSIPDGDVVDWTRIPQLEFPETGRQNSWALGAGGFKTLLMPIGFLASLLVRQRRRWGLFALTFGVIALGISLGPKIMISVWVPLVGGLCPYDLLQQAIPGFALIRSPFRFALFVELGVVWLCLEALDLLNPRRWWGRTPIHEGRIESAADVSENLSSRSSNTVAERKRSESDMWSETWEQLTTRPAWLLCPTAMIVFSLIAIFEVQPPRQRLFSRVTSQPVPNWVNWLRENSAPTDAIACLPFPNGYSVHHYQETSEWMYWQTFHGRSMVNGYSGFFPESFVTLKDQLSPGPEGTVPELKNLPWDSPGLKRLNEWGVRFVVVKRSFASPDDVWEHAATKDRWIKVTGDETHRLDVYEIQPP